MRPRSVLPMVPVIVALLLVMQTGVRCQGEWTWLNPSMPTVRYYSMDIADNFGLACGMYGAVVRTTDGGASWAQQKRFTKWAIRDVHVFDEKHAIVGDGEQLFVTENAARTWTPIDVDSGMSTTSIACVSRDSIFVVGNRSVFRTTNGGNTWDSVWSHPTERVEEIAFGSSLCGIVFTEYGKIFYSTDGGASWHPAAIQVKLNSLYINSNILAVDDTTFIAYDRTTSYRTTDGGRNWEYFDVLIDGLTALNCSASGLTVACSRKYIAILYENGRKWKQVDMLDDVSVTAVSISNSGCITLCGFDGALYSSVDTGATWISHHKPLDAFYYRDIAKNAIGEMIAVGSDASMLCSTDNGASWVDRTLGFIDGLYSIDFTSSGIGMVVGNVWPSDGLVLVSRDNGMSWKRHVVQGLEELIKCVVSSDTMGYFINGRRLLTRCKILDTSITTELALQTETRVYDVDFITPDDGIATTQDSFMITTDGGYTWTTKPWGYQVAVHTVRYRDADKIFAFGPTGEILSSTDGGDTWDSTSTGDPHNVSGGWGGMVDVDFYSPDYGIAVGGYNLSAYTTDGGTSWVMYDGGIYENAGFTSVVMTDTNRAVAIAYRAFAEFSLGDAIVSVDSESDDAREKSDCCEPSRNQCKHNQEFGIVFSVNGRVVASVPLVDGYIPQIEQERLPNCPLWLQTGDCVSRIR